MRAELGDAMRNARRLDGQRKATLVAAAVEAALQRGQHLTIAAVARDAGVGRKFIYDHPELRAEIELKAAQAAHQQANTMIAAARVTGASLRADLENSRAQNRRLQQQLRNLENRLSHVEGARLVADDLLPSDVLTQLADQQLSQRVTELERQLFETTEALRRTTEELEAARTINRELMHHANRTDPPAQQPASVTSSNPNRRNS
jgi:chromosome segregation ATPase